MFCLVVLRGIYLLYQVNNKYNNTKYLLDNKRTNVLKILQITQSISLCDSDCRIMCIIINENDTIVYIA